MKTRKLLITPPRAGAQVLTPSEAAECTRLFTAYQQAFLKEAAARIEMNLRISEMRQAEKDLKKAACELSDFRQLTLLPMPPTLVPK